MAEQDAVKDADKSERVRAVLRWKFDEGLCAPFPSVDIWRTYVFPLFTPAQMRVLDGREWRWARPAVSLEEFLRHRALGK